MREWLGLVIVAACGDDVHPIVPIDAFNIDAPPPFGACELLAQTGCAVGDKCTWVVDQFMPTYEARIACAPAGSVAVGGACTYGEPASLVTPGYDDCATGLVCSRFVQTGAGVCKTVCNLEVAAPSCPLDKACVAYDNLFEVPTGPSAGICEPTCSALDDNDFDGPGTDFTRTGTTCGSDPTIGCYGAPSHTTRPSQWTCTRDLFYSGPTPRVQGSPHAGFINGCSQGYVRLGDGFCHAACKPGNTYQGNPNPQYPMGMSPHSCTATDALGTFSGGEHCVYLWRLEYSDAGMFTRSPTSDTVGVCIDDSWPDCSTLPLTGPAGQPTARDYGCVDSITAGTLPTTRLDLY